MLKVHDSFILRTPLFPFSDLKKFFGLTGAELIEALQRNDAFLDVLNLSSKDLYTAYSTFLETGKLSPKLAESLLKYLTRACTRATTFSILATYSCGKFSDDVSLVEQDNDFHFFCAPDMLVLYEMYAKIPFTEFTQQRFYLNNTVHETNGSYKYLELKIDKTNKFTFAVSRFDKDPLIDEMVMAFKSGTTLHDLQAQLKKHGIDLHQLVEFSRQLFENNIIIPEVYPIPSPAAFSNALKGMFGGNEIYTPLLNVLDQIGRLGQVRVGMFSTAIDTLEQSLGAVGIHLGKRTLVNIETKRKFKRNELPSGIKDDLITAFHILLKTQDPFIVNDLKAFREAVFNRYENELIPLQSVLDPEQGIGYPVNASIKNYKNGIVKGLEFASKNSARENTPSFFQKKFNPADGPLDLTDSYVQAVVDEGIEASQLYSSYYGKFSITSQRDNYTEIAVDEFIGPSSTRILSRQSDDPEIDALINTLVEDDKQFFRNFEVAEIVCLPQLRAGNIINYKSHYRYQIPILTPASLCEQPLQLDSLFVTVRNEKLYLYSKELKKYIYPILPNSFNYALSLLPVYNLLCDLQHEYVVKGPVRWKWPSFVNDSYLPRVRHKNIVLSRATWTITNLPMTSEAFKEALYQKIKEQHIPDFTTLRNDPSPLFLNLKDEKFVDVAFQYYKKSGLLKLEEFLYDKSMFDQERNKPGINEYIAFIANQGLKSKIREALPAEKQKKYGLGSEWIYVKIFCPQLASTQLLREKFESFLTGLKTSFANVTWHYLRFIEADRFHIRLRLHLGAEGLFADVFERLTHWLQQLTSEHHIEEYVFDTYKPEIYRYGGEYYHALAESFFHIDSVYCLQLLKSVPSPFEWTLLRSIDALLEDFGFSAEGKLRFAEESTANYQGEFYLHNDRAFRKSVSAKYRNSRNTIAKCFEDPQLGSLLSHRSAALAPVIEQLRHNTHELRTIIESLIHIHCIRLLEARQRFQEMILYDILALYYKEKIIRTKQLPV